MYLILLFYIYITLYYILIFFIYVLISFYTLILLLTSSSYKSYTFNYESAKLA